MNRRAFLTALCVAPLLTTPRQIYVTERIESDGVFAGTRLAANSWAEAELLAHEIGVSVLGRLA